MQTKELFLLIEKNCGCISSVMDDRYVEYDENINVLYIEANNFYGRVMNQSLLYHEIKFNNSVSLEEILRTSDITTQMYTQKFPP